MSEQKNHFVKSNLDKPTRVGRRRVFEGGLKLVGGAAGLATVGSWATKEVEIGKEGIHTPFGIFYPLEERHDVGRSIDNAHRPLDGYFKETLPQYNLTLEKLTALKLKSHFGVFHTNEASDKKMWPTDLLEQLARDGTPIIMGDIEIFEKGHDMQNQFPFSTDVEKWKTTLGLSAIGVNIIDKKPTRRQFLESAGVWTGLMLTTAPWAARGPLAAALVLDPEQKAPMTRILTRLHGLANHLAPEDTVIFFRNLMMANNLLLAAKKIKEQKKALPKIAFNVGAAHAGIEDFLQVGPVFIRWVVNLYPKEYLENIIDLNGGLEDFCSVRILTLPQNFTGKKADYNAVGDQKLTDELLLKMLQQKLPEYWAKEKEEKRLGEEKRRQEVAKIREVFNYYTNTDISQQVNSFLDKLVSSEEDYKKFVRVGSLNGIPFRTDNIVTYSFNLTLPGAGIGSSPDVDIGVAETTAGQIIRESIEFYLNSSGQLTRRPEQSTTIADSKEDLRRILNTAVPTAKEPGRAVWENLEEIGFGKQDEEGWRLIYRDPEGEYGLHGRFKDGNIYREFIMEKNGKIRVDTSVLPKEAVEEGASTR